MGQAINIKNLRIVPMKTEDTPTAAAVYDTPIDLTSRFMSFTDTPTQTSANLSGDGGITNTYVAKIGGTLALNIHRIKGAERAKIYGEQPSDDNSYAMGKDDIVPYAAVIFTVENDDGTVDLYKYPKWKATEQPKTVEQKSESGVTYSTESLSGTYSFLRDCGEARYILEDLDPVADAEKITAFYTVAAVQAG